MGISAELSAGGAHASKARFEEILASRAAHYGGTVLRVDGTSVIVEFKDAADAVNCAISMQEQFAGYSRLGLDEGTIAARVGIHYGEIASAQSELTGSGAETLTGMMGRITQGKICLTREAYVRARIHIDLPFKSVEHAAGENEPELFSVEWEAVAGNLRESLKRIDEDDLQRTTTLIAKLGVEPSKRASPVIMIFLLLFIFIVFKLLKWL